MSKPTAASWRGFDYTLTTEVTLPRTEWRTLIDSAARAVRIGGDLTLFDKLGRITHEIYDKKDS